MNVKSSHALTELAVRLSDVIELHRDAGESQGYTENGYGYIPHACGTCGSFGEYGEPWPCATFLAATGRSE